MPNGSEDFRSIPNTSADFGKFPQRSEMFGTFPKATERKENHTVTVREAAKLFEQHGVARTERSIVNWCQPNRMGVARLDAYFDPNERKYYVTAESVERAIQEEQSKAARLNEAAAASEETPPKRSDGRERAPQVADGERIQELEKEVFDLRITNRGKDFLVEQLQKERDGFFGQLLEASRKVGELETKLLQLAPGKSGAEFV